MRALVALAWLSLLVSASQAEEGTYGQFRSWIAGCDNVRNCRATGFPENDADQSALVLIRAADGNSQPNFRLIMSRPEGSTSPLAGTLDIIAGEKILGTLEVGRSLVLDPEDDEHWTGSIEDSAVASAIVAALRTVKTLVVRRSGGETLANISLDGAAAALLFLDDRQHRLGTMGALIRSGDRPNSKVPPAPALPSMPRASRVNGRPVANQIPDAVKRVFEADLKADQCDADSARSGKPTIDRLTEHDVLYGMPCWSGAYATSTAFYRYDELTRRATPIQLRVPAPAKPSPDDEPRSFGHIQGGDGYSSKTGTLIGTSKGRGAGDCGSTANWVWTGKSFELTFFSVMPVCRGLLWDDWLVIHRTRDGS